MTGQLAGKRILVVEDEYFIAADLKRALRSEDAVVLGPVADADGALALIAEQHVDGGLLDVNLGTSSSFAVAEHLSARAVPWMFLTGYDGWSLPPAYRAAPRLAKPFRMRAVLGRVAAFFEPEVAR